MVRFQYTYHSYLPPILLLKSKFGYKNIDITKAGKATATNIRIYTFRPFFYQFKTNFMMIVQALKKELEF